MQIKLATPTDWPRLKAFVDNLGYFDPVFPSELGGNWLIAEADNGSITGTIWWFEGQGNAFIGYWIGVLIPAGPMLGMQLERILRARNIKHVHATIAAEREKAVRTALRLGMATTNMAFFYVTKELDNGRH